MSLSPEIIHPERDPYNGSDTLRNNPLQNFKHLEASKRGLLNLRVLLVVPSLDVLQFKGLARVSLELAKGLSKVVDLEVVEVHVSKGIIGKSGKNYLKNLTIIPFKEITSKADICHAVVPESGAIAFLKRKRMVTTFHDVIPLIFAEKLGFRKRYIFQAYVRLLWKLATRSESVLSDSTQTAIDVKKIFKRDSTVINLGVDKKFKPMYIKKGKPTLGFFANFSYRKRVNIAVEVFKKLKRKIDCKLILAGGNLNSIYQRNFNVKNMVEDLSDIEVYGYVPEEETVKLYNSFDFSLFPSLHEGFGLPILEAQRCGVPVLIKRDSMIPQEVRQATIECDSANEMAEKILYLLNNKDEYRKVSIKSQNYASKFTWQKFIKQNLSIYESLVR